MDTNKNTANEKLIEHLEAIVHYYNIVRPKGFEYRAKNYVKVINNLNEIEHRVLLKSEAQSIPGAGIKISQEIEEFGLTGTTVKLNEMRQYLKDREPYINLFIGIHGVGVVSANKLYDKGYRSLADLETANLTKAQRIGLIYYKDIRERIPREEIYETDKIIKDILSQFQCTAKVVGSYRRKENFSGDMDLLVTSSSKITMKNIVEALTPSIIKETLALGPLKFMGITSKHRRLDIRLFRKREYPCALMYFTGSTAFNVYMRSQAISLGLILNEYGLFQKTERLKVQYEKDIFKVLKVKYVPPVERARNFGNT